MVEAVKHNDNHAYEMLLEQFKKMIFFIINEYDLEYGDYQISRDDLFQEATIALYEAAISFDTTKNVKFSTFAYMVMKRRITRFYKKYKSEYECSSCSLDKFECPDHSFLFMKNSVQDNGLEYTNEQVILEQLKYGPKIISEEDKNILLLRMNDYSYKEISERLKINKKRIDNRLTRLKKYYLKNTSRINDKNKNVL